MRAQLDSPGTPGSASFTVAPPAVRLDKIVKRYGTSVAVDNVSLDVSAGEFVSLLGPSGSGKTTTLMMLAGHQTPDAGRIFIDGRDLTALPAYKRNIGMVFQNYALFPHLNVFRNVAFPLRMRGATKDVIEREVGRALSLVRLSELTDRFPSQLSGGQCQRVALARALVFHPNTLLMDEPLSALDKNLREELQLEIKALQNRLDITTLYVTHDQSEAMTLSDRIAVFNRGRVVQIGTPSELYERPLSLFVARFLGDISVLPGRVIGMRAGFVQIATDAHQEVYGRSYAPLAEGTRVAACIRPESVHLASAPGECNRIGATALAVDYMGQNWKVAFATESGAQLRARFSNSGAGAPIQPSEKVVLEFPYDQTTIITMEADDVF